MPAQRPELHRRFVERFSTHPFAPAQEAALVTAEARLGIRFPDSYRTFLRIHGGAYTPGLLELVLAREADHPDLQNLSAIESLVGTAEAFWSGGMPANVVAFGNDCMGNAFCFERVTDVRDDAAVNFFDHDFGEVYEVASSFDALLEWYLRDAP